jgi:hypothetical protein
MVLPLFRSRLVLCVVLVASVTNGFAQPTNASSITNATEQIRNDCINGRRRICGQVVLIAPGGLVVDSGYTSLLRPELARSWVIRSNVGASRPPNLIEENIPSAACVGLVFIADVPGKPKPNLYDYVVLQGYPMGRYAYEPLGGVHKDIRRFTTVLEKSMGWNGRPENGAR